MFGTPMRQFSDNLEALRDFVDEIAPVLKEKSEKDVLSSSADLGPLLYMLIETLPEDSLPAGQLKLSDEKREELKQRYADKIVIEKKEGEEGAPKSFTWSVSEDVGLEVAQVIKKFQRRYKQTALLYRSSLVTLVSSAEWFLAQLLHDYFGEYPEAVGAHEKAFSLDDLRSMGTIDDAKSRLIETRVEEVLRGSLSDWLEYLKTKVKLSLGYVGEFRDCLVEVTQRRNLLIHNGGIVNSIYMARVPEESRQGLAAGDSVDVSQEYLDRAICTFERVFLLIGAELWKKLAPEDQSRFGVLSDIAWRDLLAERWSVAEGLSYFIMQDKKLPEVSRLIGMFNYSQSLKWQDRFEEVRSQVVEADFSAKQPKFRLSQLALLDDEDGFFGLLPQVLQSGEVAEADLRSWPLFRAMRDTDTYREKYCVPGVGDQEGDPIKRST